MLTSSRFLGVALAVCSFALALSARGATGRQAPSSGPDPIPALLAEVHALRLAMEQSAAVTPRVQLTLARLNIEEQRISQLAAQLDRARQDLTQARLQSQKWSEELAEVDKRLPTESDEKVRRGLEMEMADLKLQIKGHTALEEQLRMREGDAIQALNTEQSRWIDLNSRLDELERALGPVPR
jgi:seryl-tRNA synthetase